MTVAADVFEALRGSELMTDVVHTPAGGGAATGFEARLLRGGEAGIAMIGAAELGIQFSAADVATFAQGDTVTVDGLGYTVRDRIESLCSPDGVIVAWALRKAA